MEGLRKGRYMDVIDALRITLIRGKAAFVSKSEVKVNGQNIEYTGGEVHYSHRFKT